MKVFLFVLLAIMSSMSPVMAADICEAIAMRDVKASENASSILHKDQHLVAVNSYVKIKNSPKAYFCQHGGYCYSADAMKLLNCNIGKEVDNDGVEVSFELNVIRSKNSNIALRYDDIDNALLALGMCSGCASNATSLYVKNPNSECGKLVKGALDNDPAAIEAIKAEGNACYK